MFFDPNPRSARSLFLSLLLLCALVTITAYVYSPWHQHNRLSRAQCDFAQFENGSNLNGSESLIIAPDVGSAFRESARIPADAIHREPTVFSGRPPPASL